MSKHIVSELVCPYLEVLPISFEDVGARRGPQPGFSALRSCLAEELAALLEDLAQDAVRLCPRTLYVRIDGAGVDRDGKNRFVGVGEVTLGKFAGEEDIAQFRAPIPNWSSSNDSRMNSTMTTLTAETHRTPGLPLPYS